MAELNTEKYLISLLKSTINNEAAPPLPEDMDCTALLKLAKHHSVANTAYYALEQLGSLSPELREEWSQLRDREIMRDIHQQTEYDILCEAFAQEKIRFLPLKGILIKSLYPQSDFRTMSDIDLLIDEANAEKVKDVMLSLGYEVDSVEFGVHDVYHKKPVVSIEVHRELFGDEGQEFAPLFSDPWNKCEKRSDTLYEFTPQYFFAYLLAHGIKHYQQGGTGIRTFMDIEIYRRHFGQQLDMDKLYDMFEKAGQRKLCEDFIRLSELWFGAAEDDGTLDNISRYIISGGTYGTFENQVQYELQSKSKGQYIMSKLFPNFQHMKQQYPVLKKAPILLPVMWLVRLVTKPFINRKENAEKLKALSKNK